MDEKEKYESDPSTLTTQQLLREIGSLKELLLTKLDGVEKAVQVAHDDFVRFPTEVQKEVGSLKELIVEKILGQVMLNNEKLKGVDQRFVLTEQIRNEQNHSNAIAINKNEASTSKQLDQLSQQLGQVSKNIDDKINDLKERVTAGSSTLLGTKIGTKDSMGWIAFAILVIGFLINYIMKQPK